MIPRKPSRTLSARWIFPVDGAPIPGGTVTIGEDRILAVEQKGKRKADEDLGNVAVLPGLVNAHTHLDLTGLRGLTPPTPDFTAWLRAVVEQRRRRSPKQVQVDIRAGLAESLNYGTTLIGDIVAQGQSWPILSRSALRAVVFYEVLGLTKERAAAAQMAVKNWLRDHSATPTCRPALSPHAPYSVRSSLFNHVTILAKRSRCTLASHLAETLAELELLRNHHGPFVDFLKEMGVWDPRGLVKNPAEVIEKCSPVSTLFVHANYLAPSTRIPGNSSIVFCPRTHAAFGHPPHPFREFLTRGIQVAFGTDSLASNPDLSVLAEARFLHRHYPDVTGATLLRMATLSGAEALGWHKETGSLTPGKSADLVVLPLPRKKPADPFGLVFDSDRVVERVMFRGKWV
jgi:cytosine/adenosine deaminase-related metal-dependent hydrolase